ncbi:MAG: hypothetical protein RL030_1732 [Pseudomonadota bacterium]|jgi:hypothetical protein
MQRRKSARHIMAANARWRAAEARAQAERDAGTPDRPALVDHRQPFDLDLTSWGGPRLHVEPRLGYIAARAIGDDGTVTVAALKTLLHGIADALPRTLSARSLAA